MPRPCPWAMASSTWSFPQDRCITGRTRWLSWTRSPGYSGKAADTWSATRSGWPRVFVWAISMTVPRDLRRHYWGSIRSSYIAVELRAIPERSRLTGWRIVADGLALMVIKEA
jgi:hypothetical protein